MQKILLFFTFNTSLIDWKNSGILDRELNYYDKLSKSKKVNITFFTYGDEKDLDTISRLDTNIEIITLFKKKRIKNSIIVFLRSLFFIILNRKLFKKFDIYKSNQNLGSWLPVICKLIYNKKLISRGGYDLFHFSIKKKNPLKIIISYIICFFVYRNSNIIFIPTEFYKRFIIKFFFIKEKKIAILPNYIDLTIFKRNNKINRKKNEVLFIGRLEKQKNIFNMVNYFKNNKFQLHILGNGSLKNKLSIHIKKKYLNVKFINQKVNNKLLPDLLNRYNFFILLSLYEGNPKVLLEAMSCELCPIVSDVVGINNIVDRGKNGLFFDLNNINELNMLKKMSIIDIRKLQTNARKFIYNNNSIDTIIYKENIIISDL